MKYLKSLIILIGVLASLLAQVRSETITYMHTDALGTPVAATDESGNVLWREHYTPFGEKVDKEAASVNNSIGYTGHVNDSDTGLTYMQARYYDPVIGRFYSNDPIGFRDVHSFNRYAYGNNNPYKYVDLDGRESVMAVQASADVRSLGQGTISRDQFAARQAGRVQASRIALKFSPQGRMVLAVLSGLDVVLSKKAEDSGKNSAHGDDGRAKSKADKATEKLEKQLDGAPKKEKNKIKKKIQRIKEDAEKKSKGEEHSRRAK